MIDELYNQVFKCFQEMKSLKMKLTDTSWFLPIIDSLHSMFPTSSLSLTTFPMKQVFGFFSDKSYFYINVIALYENLSILAKKMANNIVLLTRTFMYKHTLHRKNILISSNSSLEISIVFQGCKCWHTDLNMFSREKLQSIYFLSIRKYIFNMLSLQKVIYNS